MVKPHTISEVELRVTGRVSSQDRELALNKIRALCELGHEPILDAVVKLKVRPKATLELPSIAEASLNLNGDLVRAHAAGQTIGEAIDLLDNKLGRRLRRRRKRFEDRRHDAEPENRGHVPGYVERPHDERDVVRHKTLAMRPVSLEEAADEMDQLDHDFYLYLDVDHDIDRVIYRNGDGELHVAPAVDGENLPGDTRPTIYSGPLVLNHLPLLDAERLLDHGNEPFVFFAESDNGRSQVLYRRFDGHYGLITPAI